MTAHEPEGRRRYVTVRMTASDLIDLRRAAEKHEISMAELARQAIRHYLGGAGS